MASVVIEDHANQTYGLKITADGRATVDADITDIGTRALYNGNLFAVRLMETIVADDAYQQILIYTGTSGTSAVEQSAHMTITVAGGGDVILQIYEAPTVTASGSQVVIYNKNRASVETSNVTAYHTPTIGASGTMLVERLIPGGEGAADVGGEVTSSPWIFTPGEDYLISVKNIAGSTQPSSIALDWIEL